MNAPYPRGTIVVYRDNSIWGSIIRFGSGGKWDHVAMALGDGTAIQALPFKGVCLAPDFLQETLETFPYPGDVERCISFYQECMKHGDKYDLVGLLSNPFYNITGSAMPLHPGEWNCATLLAAPMIGDPKVAGMILKKPPSTFTPNDFKVMFGEK